MIKVSSGLKLIFRCYISIFALRIRTKKAKAEPSANVSQQKNQEIIYGKYCLTDDGKIEYKSLKWVPSSKKDPTCVFELMINCLKEFAQAHDEIVNSESCL